MGEAVVAPKDEILGRITAVPRQISVFGRRPASLNFS
jgi:hypothetical protein